MAKNGVVVASRGMTFVCVSGEEWRFCGKEGDDVSVSQWRRMAF